MSSVQPSQEVLVSGAGRPVEQSFQTVNKKPSQAGGRKGASSKDHAHTGSRSHAHSHRGEDSSQVDSGPRKKMHSSHSKDKETKSRSSNQRYSSSKSSMGSSSTQSKSKDSNHAYHHSSRHRNTNSSDAAIGSSGKSIGKPASKIMSSNRFEKLDPDMDCESSSTMMGVSSCASEEDSTLGSATATSSVSASSSTASIKGAEERKTGGSGAKERSSRGGRSSGRKGPSGRHVQDVNGSASTSASTEDLESEDREDPASKKKSSKHIKFDVSCGVDMSGRQDSAYSSGASTSISSMSTDHEERVDEDLSQSVLLVEESGEKSGDEEHPASVDPEACDQETNKLKRIVYGREALMQLKTVPLSREFPALVSRKGIGIFIEPPSKVGSNSDDQAQSDNSNKPPEDGPRPKHPTALSLIKDHDKLLGKVSLSPQRRSFQRGCSWKEKSLSSSANGDSSSPTAASPLSNSHSDAHFSFDSQKHHGGHSGTGHSVPRVIHHTPLREREGKRDSKKNWESTGQDSHRSRGPRNNHYQEEPEPEWMEFGPIDRFDVIELRGFEEDEEESQNTAEELAEPPEENSGDGAALTSPEEKDGPIESSDKSQVKEKSEKLESDSSSKKTVEAGPKGVLPTSNRNEYILDGFDFTHGVSICQELDLDEDEGGVKESLSASLLPSEAMNSPTQLSNALLKVLGVNGCSDNKTTAAEPSQSTASSLAQHPPGMEQPPKSSVAGGGSVPVNALTLDEVHARENIHHPPTSGESVANGSSGQGMAAFNKLIAAMESSKAQQDSKKGNPSSEDSSRYPHQVDHGATTAPTSHPMHFPHRYPLQGASRPSEKGVGRAPLPPIYNLERELLDLEEDLSTSEDFLRGTGEPNLRRLEQLRHMINKLDYADPMATSIPQPSPYGHHPHPAHQHLRTHPSTSHTVHMDRDGGPRSNWMFTDRQRHQMEWGLRPSPHQIALARQQQQQQMMAGTGSGSVGRSANNWAVEMERRRIMELRQMQMAKEKEGYPQQATPPHTYGNSVPPSHSSTPSSKPNISLLPTAVVRQMHSSKSSHQDGEVSKLSGVGTQSHQVHNSQMHSSESNIHPHPPGQPPPPPPPTHAPGLGDYGGYHHHHAPQMPPRVGPGPPIAGSAYPHKVMSDSLPPMAYHPHYNMAMSHGGLPVQTPYPY